MVKPHIDFLLTINKGYVDRVLSGEVLTEQEIQDAYLVANEINSIQVEKMDNHDVRLNELENTALEALAQLKYQYKRSEDSFMAFLKSRGLEEDFEVYSMRIDRKIYKSQRRLQCKLNQSV